MDIKDVLPHRYPFLFIDGVTDKEELKWVKGFKLVSQNEWFMNQNDDKPTMPEVLILEAVGQLGAFVLPEEEKDLGLLTSIKNVKFFNQVYAGDQLNLYFEVIKKRSKLFKGKGFARVGQKRILEVDEITVTYLQ